MSYNKSKVGKLLIKNKNESIFDFADFLLGVGFVGFSADTGDVHYLHSASAKYITEPGAVEKRI
jgi:hypothetical protein